MRAHYAHGIVSAPAACAPYPISCVVRARAPSSQTEKDAQHTRRAHNIRMLPQMMRVYSRTHTRTHDRGKNQVSNIGSWRVPRDQQVSPACRAPSPSLAPRRISIDPHYGRESGVRTRSHTNAASTFPFISVAGKSTRGFLYIGTYNIIHEKFTALCPKYRPSQATSCKVLVLLMDPSLYFSTHSIAKDGGVKL